MATDPPPFVTFRARPSATDAPAPAGPATPAPASPLSPSEMETPVERIAVYQLALDLAKQLYTVIELTEGVERFYLRDTLDRKSTAIPLLVKRGLAMADMSGRRAAFRNARYGAADCAALLDVLEQRGTVEDEAIANARSTASALIAQLDALTVTPPKVF